MDSFYGFVTINALVLTNPINSQFVDNSDILPVSHHSVTEFVGCLWEM